MYIVKDQQNTAYTFREFDSLQITMYVVYCNQFRGKQLEQVSGGTGHDKGW